MSDREFLFEYRWKGATWSITIHATDPAEAKEKIKAAALARYEGEVFERFDVYTGLWGVVPRILVWWRNRKSRAA